MSEPATTTAQAEPEAPFDPAASRAFALGWEIVSLFRGASFGDGGDGEQGGLPRLDTLSERQRTALAANLIEANLRKLGEALTAASPVEPANLERLRRTVEADPVDSQGLREAVEALNVDLLFTLTAADLRLGRAYGLGQALADTCLRPQDRPSFDLAFGTRLVRVKDWLADLASSFPPHSSRAVVLSLRAWEAWAADPKLGGEPLVWETDGVGVREALRRQGDVWRDLLIQDKRGEDMLNTDHYLRAANSLVAAMASTVWRFLRPLRIPLAAAILLLGGGIALLLLTGAVGQVVGAIAVAAGAVGVTGAGIRARLGKVATQLQSRLWGAELDLAIAEAVLIGPAGWGAGVAKIAVPASGGAPKAAANIEVLRELRRAVAERQDRRIRGLLAPDVVFEGGGEVRHGRHAVAEWLLRTPEGPRVASPPKRVVAVGPGFLITHLERGADVWRVQEGRVRWWRRCGDGDEAHAAAQAAEAGRPILGERDERAQDA
jgi:hypothetical protein